MASDVNSWVLQYQTSHLGPSNGFVLMPGVPNELTHTHEKNSQVLNHRVRSAFKQISGSQYFVRSMTTQTIKEPQPVLAHYSSTTAQWKSTLSSTAQPARINWHSVPYMGCFPPTGLQWYVNMLINMALDSAHTCHTTTHTNINIHTNTNTYFPILSTESTATNRRCGRPLHLQRSHMSQTSK